MIRQRSRRDVFLFVAGFLLAGALHLLDRHFNALLLEETPDGSAALAFGSTVLFVLNLAIYCFLLLRWTLSVYTRLLPSRSRAYLMGAAAMMLVFLLIRSIKYRQAAYNSPMEHFLWYAYYVPLLAVPGLFLLTCLRMEPKRKGGVLLTHLVWGIMLVMILLVATNDLHRWMFSPRCEEVGGSWSSYKNEPLWYIYYGVVILYAVAGLVLLVVQALRHGGRHVWRRTLLPVLLTLLTPALLRVSDRFLFQRRAAFPWAFPEMAVFCMLGILESCIRSRLIPFNENYERFFEKLQLSAEVTDPSLHPVFTTAAPFSATDEQRRASLHEPLLLDEDTRLFGRALPAGYAFWTGDERTLRLRNKTLAETAELLESENELLRFETEQLLERARVDVRNSVYARAAAEVYDTQKEIAALLTRLEPDAPDYAQTLAAILLRTAFVKRQTNFVLQGAERETVTAQELCLALEESARFLALCGVQASVEQKSDCDCNVRDALRLYRSFEALIERMPGRTNDLLITLTPDALRLMADCPPPETLPQTPDAVDAVFEDGQLYLTVRIGKGGAA